MYLDCFGVTTEKSAICVFFLIRHGDSVVLVTLTATLVSINVELEWKVSRLAVTVDFSNSVIVPVVFDSGGWSTKAVIVFVVFGGIVRASSLGTDWSLAVVSLEAVLPCIIKCGKWLRPWHVSMTTLLFLIKCNPKISSATSPIRQSGEEIFCLQLQI